MTTLNPPRKIRDRRLIGTVEWVEVPKWGLAVRARTDTGALTSALHVENLEWVSRKHLRFDVAQDPRDGGERTTVTAMLVREGRVRSSNGISEIRPFINLSVRLGEFERDIEVGLLDRGRMRHRMLLGRKALHGLLVDPDHRYLLSERPAGKRRKKKVKKKKAKKKVSRKDS